MKTGCETCPIVQGCAEIAEAYKGFSVAYEQEIVKEEQLPGQVLDLVDRVGVALKERVAELTYDSMAGRSQEELDAIHKEEAQRDRTFRAFEEITLHDESLARIEGIRQLQAAYMAVAQASEEYAQELQRNCKKGVGKIRPLGLIGAKHLYCRSGGEGPNLRHFTATELYQDLDKEVEKAHARHIASYSA